MGISQGGWLNACWEVVTESPGSIIEVGGVVGHSTSNSVDSRTSLSEAMVPDILQPEIHAC